MRLHPPLLLLLLLAGSVPAAGSGWRRRRRRRQRARSERARTPVPEHDAGALVKAPLPNCSVVFFHHIEKTAGTTLRTVFQRSAQLGEFDLFAFVNRQHRLSMQILLSHLDRLMSTPGGLENLRLLVEIHIGADLSHPYFFMYTLPSLLLVRSRLRAAGCACNFVSLLRYPLLQHLSWHGHFCAGRVPLCFWRGAANCQTRLALGITCHDSASVPILQNYHEKAVERMWEAFDLVGVTENFDEFLLLLADMTGLQHPAYRMQTVGTHTLARQRSQREWTNRSCAALLDDPPADLLALISKRLDDSSRGKRQGDPMECNTYGPCLTPDFTMAQQRQRDAPFDRVACGRVSPQEVLRRLCMGLKLDERVYFSARQRFDALVAAHAPSLRRRVDALRAANQALSERAEAQAAESIKLLEVASGTTLQRHYKQGLWVVDERASWYKPHERARFSCVNCSGDVVPEFDFGGCWPLWTQFAPDELALQCSRKWTADPGDHKTAVQLYRVRNEPLPCWQTCWRPINRSSSAAVMWRGNDSYSRLLQHCTARCPSAIPGAVGARDWWDTWKAAVRDLEATSEEARELAALRSHFGPERDIDRIVAGVF